LYHWNNTEYNEFTDYINYNTEDQNHNGKIQFLVSELHSRLILSDLRANYLIVCFPMNSPK